MKNVRQRCTLAFIDILLFLLCCALLWFSVPVSNVAYAASSRESESNNTAATPNTVSINSAFTGSLSANSDIDWYKFSTSNNGYFNITFNHTFVDSSKEYWRIYIYDSTGINFIDGYNTYYSVLGNANKTTNTYGVPAGTYYIKIIPYNYSSNSYEITVNFTSANDWETENNNTAGSAENISVNTKYYGTISTSGDVDWYKFTINSDGYISVTLNHDLVDSSREYWRIYIYDSTGINFIDGYNMYYSVLGNANKTTNIYGIPAGTYYIKLIPYNHSANKYEIAVNFTSANDWETENNNTAGSAENISVNTKYYGTISTSGDVDWYKFTTNSDGYISVTLNHDLVDSSREYWRIYIYDSTGINFIDGISTYTSVLGNANKTTNIYGIPAGTYYIKLIPYNHSANKYEIAVNFTSANDWETENNNTTESSDSILLNKAYNGSISSSGDVDWFKFTLNSNIQLSVSFSHESIDSSKTYWKIYIYDSSAVTKLLTYEVKGNIESVMTDYISASSGTYYLKVECYNYTAMQYSFSITEKHDHRGTWTQTLSSTCTESGVESRTCTVCGLVETRDIDAHGHTYDNGKVIKAAGVAQKGETQFTCSICGEQYIERDGHLLWVIPVICVGGVLVIVGIVNYVIIIKKKRY